MCHAPRHRRAPSDRQLRAVPAALLLVRSALRDRRFVCGVARRVRGGAAPVGRSLGGEHDPASIPHRRARRLRLRSTPRTLRADRAAVPVGDVGARRCRRPVGGDRQALGGRVRERARDRARRRGGVARTGDRAARDLARREDDARPRVPRRGRDVLLRRLRRARPRRSPALAKSGSTRPRSERRSVRSRYRSAPSS
jgi:hypothetical protein